MSFNDYGKESEFIEVQGETVNATHKAMMARAMDRDQKVIQDQRELLLRVHMKARKGDLDGLLADLESHHREIYPGHVYRVMLGGGE